jgi:hypothetical protein
MKEFDPGANTNPAADNHEPAAVERSGDVLHYHEVIEAFKANPAPTVEGTSLDESVQEVSSNPGRFEIGVDFWGRKQMFQILESDVKRTDGSIIQYRQKITPAELGAQVNERVKQWAIHEALLATTTDATEHEKIEKAIESEVAFLDTYMTLKYGTDKYDDETETVAGATELKQLNTYRAQITDQILNVKKEETTQNIEEPVVSTETEPSPQDKLDALRNELVEIKIENFTTNVNHKRMARTYTEKSHARNALIHEILGENASKKEVLAMRAQFDAEVSTLVQARIDALKTPSIADRAVNVLSGARKKLNRSNVGVQKSASESVGRIKRSIAVGVLSVLSVVAAGSFAASGSNSETVAESAKPSHRPAPIDAEAHVATNAPLDSVEITTGNQLPEGMGDNETYRFLVAAEPGIAKILDRNPEYRQAQNADKFGKALFDAMRMAEVIEAQNNTKS